VSLPSNLNNRSFEISALVIGPEKKCEEKKKDKRLSEIKDADTVTEINRVSTEAD